MKHHYFWTLVIICGVVELYSVFPHRYQGTPAAPQTVSGIIHVHSTFSDGGGSPEEIADAAQQAGLDFVILTDHNNYTARKKGFEKAYGNTDLYVEMEAATTAGHALSFFSQTSIKDADDESIIQQTYRHFLGSDSKPGLFIALSHPSNVKNPWSRLDRFGDGLEVINFDSTWQRQLSDSILNFALTVALYPFNNYLSALRFFEVYPKDFTAWDEMTARGPGHFALLAHDTHSKLKLNNEYSLGWPSYLQTFKLASNVIFLKEAKAPGFEERKTQIYKALREGRSALVFQALAPFAGNAWQAKCKDSSYSAGDTIADKSDCKFEIQLPDTPFPKIVRLIKNGEIQNEVLIETSQNGLPLELSLSGGGTYRVEVWAKMHTALRLVLNRLVPYVFYNPIYVH